MVVPQNGWFIMEDPNKHDLKWMVWRYLHFRKPPYHLLQHMVIKRDLQPFGTWRLLAVGAWQTALHLLGNGPEEPLARLEEVLQPWPLYRL